MISVSNVSIPNTSDNIISISSIISITIIIIIIVIIYFVIVIITQGSAAARGLLPRLPQDAGPCRAVQRLNSYS